MRPIHEHFASIPWCSLSQSRAMSARSQSPVTLSGRAQPRFRAGKNKQKPQKVGSARRPPHCTKIHFPILSHFEAVYEVPKTKKTNDIIWRRSVQNSCRELRSGAFLRTKDNASFDRNVLISVRRGVVCPYFYSDPLVFSLECWNQPDSKVSRLVWG